MTTHSIVRRIKNSVILLFNNIFDLLKDNSKGWEFAVFLREFGGAKKSGNQSVDTVERHASQLKIQLNCKP